MASVSSSPYRGHLAISAHNRALKRIPAPVLLSRDPALDYLDPHPIPLRLASRRWQRKPNIPAAYG